MKWLIGKGIFAALALLASGSSAQTLANDAPETVSARDAASLVAALTSAGYDAQIQRIAETGEIEIEIDVDGDIVAILFSDCDEAVPEFCDTLVLSSAFARNIPISDAQIRAANRDHKYVSIWRDDEGDSVVQWAILTHDSGIATPLFLEILRRYSSVTDDFAEIAWEGDTQSSVSGTLFVANKRGNTLSKIDLATGEEVLRKDSCTNPHELATSPDGEFVALGCYGGTTIDIFSAADLGKVVSVELGENARPHGLVWMPDGTIYATAEGRRSIFRVEISGDWEPNLAEFPTGKEGSHMLAVAPDEKTAWTTDLSSKTVTRIDLTGKQEPLSITVGEEPEGIDLSPDGKTLWISARGSDQAFALDPVTMGVRETVKTGRFPLRLLVRPQGDVAITSDLADGALTVIDVASAKVERSIAVSSPQEAEKRQQVTILWSKDGTRIYVAETGSDTIAEVDYESGKVLRRINVGKGGDGLAILP
ncbi:MAG: beta-propeller fold lactonase family protein [Erythrobacter sp.]